MVVDGLHYGFQTVVLLGRDVGIDDVIIVGIGNVIVNFS